MAACKFNPHLGSDLAAAWVAQANLESHRKNQHFSMIELGNWRGSCELCLSQLRWTLSSRWFASWKLIIKHFATLSWKISPANWFLSCGPKGEDFGINPIMWFLMTSAEQKDSLNLRRRVLLLRNWIHLFSLMFRRKCPKDFDFQSECLPLNHVLFNF